MPASGSRIGRSEIGRIVAQRTLIEGIADKTREVVVSLMAPRHRSDGEWECAFRIDGREEPIVRSSIGVDSLQSLMTAIQGIRMTLEATGGRFGRYRPGDGAGINQQIPMWFGARAEARVNRAVEREMARRLKDRLKATKEQIEASEAELNERKKILTDWERALRKRKSQLILAERERRADVRLASSARRPYGKSNPRKT